MVTHTGKMIGLQPSGCDAAADSESLNAGFNYSPSPFARVKLNYILATEQSVEHSQILPAMQISF